MQEWNGGAVHDNGAGAALGQAAAEFRATQTKIVAQRVEQHAVGRRVYHVITTINIDRDPDCWSLVGPC